MIEQKAIYEAAQTAFEAHHPKFPWPKKHNLDEQTDEFKKAFLVFSTEINAMCDRDMKLVIDECNKLREAYVEKINEVSTARENARIANRQADKAEAKRLSAMFGATLAWCLVAALGFALFLVSIN